MANQPLTDEEFWTEFKNLLFAEDKIESSKEEVEKIIDLAGLDEGSKVLDMPSGVGRHSIELQKKGFEVVGVDKTSAYIEDARHRGEAEEIEFIREDMKTSGEKTVLKQLSTGGTVSDTLKTNKMTAKCWKTSSPL